MNYHIVFEKVYYESNGEFQEAWQCNYHVPLQLEHSFHFLNKVYTKPDTDLSIRAVYTDGIDEITEHIDLSERIKIF